ncbi:MAG: hypothetical protein ISN29_00935 [Gammaproteobacteria bacterium AqS3]|nr:hypothetical protein [Gammaproteobacteria bacterium AqS3]
MKGLSYWLRRISEFWSAIGVLGSPTGLAAALAAGLGLGLLWSSYGAHQHLQKLRDQPRNAPLALVFLQPGAASARVEALIDEFSDRREVLGVSLISPDAGLELLRRDYPLGEVVDELAVNPLPSVLRLRLEPLVGQLSAAELDQLRSDWRALDGVDVLEIDASAHRHLQRYERWLGRTAPILLALALLLCIWLTEAAARRWRPLSPENLMLYRQLGASWGYLLYRLLCAQLWCALAGCIAALLIMGAAREILALEQAGRLAGDMARWHGVIWEALWQPAVLLISLAGALALIGCALPLAWGRHRLWLARQDIWG